MGLLVDGVWRDDSFDKARMEGGRFNRPTTKFRNWVTPDGSPGPSGEGGFPAEAGRYHLYVSLACPWAHRTIIFRHLKKLESVISMSVTSWHMGDDGWTFDTEEGSSGDTVNGTQQAFGRSICGPTRNTPAASPCRCCGTRSATPSSTTSRPRSSGCSTRRSTLLTNERTDYYPPDLRSEIDAVNDLVYANVNNGVYRAGFATVQAAYEEAFRNVFATLDDLERRLSRQRYRRGRAPDRGRLAAVPHAHPLRRGLLQPLQVQPAAHRRLSEPVELSARPLSGAGRRRDREHRSHQAALLRSQRKVNPTGIVPLGPELDFTAPHDRDRFVS